jgi:two-component system cell cycle sensor histidine kinase/response regulator CckA
MQQKLLILDDEALILRSLENLFEDDYEVFTARDAEEALQLAQQHDMAVIVSDERMPGTCGHEFLRRAREVSRATRILMSGYADMGALAQAVNDGQIFAFTAKPWEPLKFSALIGSAVVHFKLVQEADHERGLLRALMENIPDLIYFQDRQSRFTRVNNAHARYLGARDADECIGKSNADYFEPEAVLDWRLHEEDMVRSGQPRIDQIQQVRNQRGGVNWWSTTEVPMFDRSGQISGIAGISRDITALKNSESMLREQSDRNRMILETAADAFIGMDSDGAVTAWNPQAELAFGWTAGEAMGRRWYDIVIPPEYRHLHARGMEHFLAAARGSMLNRKIQLVASRRDGREFPVEATIWPVRIGDSCSFNALVHDITERQRLEEQLRQSQKMEAIGVLAGGLAHDFNNMLTVIIGYSEMILDDDMPPAQTVEKVDQVKKAATHAAALTGQLLAFGRRQLVQRRVLDVNTIVESNSKIFRQSIGADIELITALDAGLGFINADPGQIEQILMNLVVNAKGAMPQGGRIKIETKNITLDKPGAAGTPAGNSGSYVMLAVSDTGCGMDASTQARIFEPFFTTKGLGKGTGLGLSIIYGIVKQSEGDIRVLSKPGQGTRFEILLPRSEQTLERSGLEPGRDQAVSNNVPNAPIGFGTILVVEDKTVLRQLIGTILKKRGYDVLTAGDADEALQICERRDGEIDLILSDIVMPGMSGPGLVEMLRQRNSEMRVLYMSGSAREGVAADHDLDPEIPFIRKPFTTVDLIGKIRDILER